MCYPYGAYNKDTLRILNKLNCAIGITCKLGKVTLGKIIEQVIFKELINSKESSFRKTAKLQGIV
jgi:hypothetical protein